MIEYMQNQKWTVLVYANGNNELEPEMHQCLLDLEKVGSSKNTHVVLEIGREDRNLVSMMRPKEVFPVANTVWTGVRRYNIEEREAILMEDLGRINMADPINLYNFIVWGIQNFKSERYILVIGGHGVSFVGGIIDLSQKTPYYMGTPEMAQAIQLACEKCQKNIDMLVLDMCYMNYIEVLYEFGLGSQYGVKSILTYKGDGPLKGMPHDQFLLLLDQNAKEVNLSILIKKLIDGLNMNMAAFEINCKKLAKVKALFNDLALSYIKEKKNTNTDVPITVEDPDFRKLLHRSLKEINETVLSLVIYNPKPVIAYLEIIRILDWNINKLIFIYARMHFSQNNYWTQLLGPVSVGPYSATQSPIQLMPMALSRSVFLSLLEELNPRLPEEELIQILHQLEKFMRDRDATPYFESSSGS